MQWSHFTYTMYRLKTSCYICDATYLNCMLVDFSWFVLRQFNLSPQFRRLITICEDTQSERNISIKPTTSSYYFLHHPTSKKYLTCHSPLISLSTPLSPSYIHGGRGQHHGQEDKQQPRGWSEERSMDHGGRPHPYKLHRKPWRGCLEYASEISRYTYTYMLLFSDQSILLLVLNFIFMLIMDGFLFG